MTQLLQPVESIHGTSSLKHSKQTVEIPPRLFRLSGAIGTQQVADQTRCLQTACQELRASDLLGRDHNLTPRSRETQPGELTARERLPVIYSKKDLLRRFNSTASGVGHRTNGCLLIHHLCTSEWPSHVRPACAHSCDARATFAYPEGVYPFRVLGQTSNTTLRIPFSRQQLHP